MGAFGAVLLLFCPPEACSACGGHTKPFEGQASIDLRQPLAMLINVDRHKGRAQPS